MKQLSSSAITAMAAKRRHTPDRPPFDRIALLLQGGGALGSYQGGVYAALAEANLQRTGSPVFGAINGALIAGNAPERRVEQLRTFWEQITAAPLTADAWLVPLLQTSDIMRGWINKARKGILFVLRNDRWRRPFLAQSGHMGLPHYPNSNVADGLANSVARPARVVDLCQCT